jgi:hypothetical protein
MLGAMNVNPYLIKIAEEEKKVKERFCTVNLTKSIKKSNFCEYCMLSNKIRIF